MTQEEARKELDNLIDFTIELVRRAILTLAAMPVQKGPRQYGSTLDGLALREWSEYGDHNYAVMPRPSRLFQPTPQDVSRCLPVMQMFAWYGHNESREKADCFYKWVMGTAQKTLAKLYHIDRKTVERWRRGLAKTLIEQFPVEIAKYSIDKRPECPTDRGIHKYNGDLRPETDGEPKRSPRFIREDKSLHLPQSKDHKNTLKRLIKNRRKYRETV